MDKTSIMEMENKVSNSDPIQRKVRRYSNFERRKFPFIYLLITFPVLQFALFWGYANASSIALSFINMNGDFTFGYFQEVSDAFFGQDAWGYSLMDSLSNSLKVWGLKNLI